MVAHGLCAKHDTRVKEWKQLVAPWEANPTLGVLPRGDDWVLCLECGRTFKNLGTHLKFKHGMTGDEFKRRHELPMNAPLMCESMTEKIGAESRQRVGSPAWRRFERRRDQTNGVTIALATIAPHTLGTRRALSEGATGRPRTRRCPMCGNLLKPRQRYCCRSCAEAHRLLKIHERDARKAGEPMNFVRSPGDGGKITSDTIMDTFGITWDAWRHRVDAGTAPIHDGRVDGQRFWWGSTIHKTLRRA